MCGEIGASTPIKRAGSTKQKVGGLNLSLHNYFFAKGHSNCYVSSYYSNSCNTTIVWLVAGGGKGIECQELHRLSEDRSHQSTTGHCEWLEEMEGQE